MSILTLFEPEPRLLLGLRTPSLESSYESSSSCGVSSSAIIPPIPAESTVPVPEGSCPCEPAFSVLDL